MSSFFSGSTCFFFLFSSLEGAPKEGIKERKHLTTLVKHTKAKNKKKKDSVAVKEEAFPGNRREINPQREINEGWTRRMRTSTAEREIQRAEEKKEQTKIRA